MSKAIYLTSAIAAIAMATSSQANAAPFNITLNYTNDVPPEISQAMGTAARIWEYLLPSYASTPSDQTNAINPATGQAFRDPLEISVTVEQIDGPGGTLGASGPSSVFPSTDMANLYTQTGSMTFDAADLSLDAVMRNAVSIFTHEMAHVIGFGSLWDLGPYDLTNNEDIPGVLAPTQYKGINALAAYRDEVDPNAAFVPLEQFGGRGRAGVHWDEARPDGQTLVPGDFFASDLMSTTVGTTSETFISETTLAAFADLGFNTRANYEAMSLDQLIAATSTPAVPLPAGGWLLLIGLGSLGVMCRQRSNKTA